MGQTVVSPTVASGTVGQDDDVDVKGPNAVGITSVAFNSMGTTPVLGTLSGRPGGARIKLTSGSGSPAIAANNVVVTLAGSNRTPRKVFLAVTPAANAPGFHVASVGAGTVTIGTKVAPAASTAYELDLITLY